MAPRRFGLVPLILMVLIMAAGLNSPVSAEQVGETETVVGSVFGESINKTLGVGAPMLLFSATLKHTFMLKPLRKHHNIFGSKALSSS